MKPEANKAVFTKTSAGDTSSYNYSTQGQVIHTRPRATPSAAAAEALGAGVPDGTEPGRVSDFLLGAHEASDQRSKAGAEVLGVAAGLLTYSAFRRYLRNR
jgi:hypothetical protein